MTGSDLPLGRLPLAPGWEGDHRARVAASTRKFRVPILVGHGRGRGTREKSEWFVNVWVGMR